jgi:hypothetical protein
VTRQAAVLVHDDQLKGALIDAAVDLVFKRRQEEELERRVGLGVVVGRVEAGNVCASGSIQ